MRNGRWEPDDDPDDDYTEDDDDGLVACSYCGEEMYDDSPRCPSCGRYLSREDAPPEKKPAWIMITAVVLLIIMLSWLANYL